MQRSIWQFSVLSILICIVGLPVLTGLCLQVHFEQMGWIDGLLGSELHASIRRSLTKLWPELLGIWMDLPGMLVMAALMLVVGVSSSQSLRRTGPILAMALPLSQLAIDRAHEDVGDWSLKAWLFYFGQYGFLLLAFAASCCLRRRTNLPAKSQSTFVRVILLVILVATFAVAALGWRSLSEYKSLLRSLLEPGPSV